MIKHILLTLLFSFFCLTSWADTVTYYFNAYDSGGEEWETNPANMVDGNIATGADAVVPDTQLLTGNTCDGTDLGTISKVELRLYGGFGTVFFDDVYLRPVFTAGDGDNHDIGASGTSSDVWSNYIDITSDTNAPSWTWGAVQSLECDVDAYNAGIRAAVAAKVEIRVTYTGVSARRIIMIQ